MHADPLSPARRPSMADVAAAAGVSGQTVSRVVNGSPRVNPATRIRVEQAMDRLGYRPHRAARALRTGRTQTIGLVAATLASVGNSRMLQAVAQAASSRAYALTVLTASDAGGIAAAFERLHEQGVDGAIVLNEATELARGARAPEGIALVLVDSPLVDASAGSAIVQTDHAGGARLATEHLLQVGHGTVHHLAGPRDSFAAHERERGWREALADAGARVPEPLRGDWTAASGSAAQVPRDATAVFAANDQMALGLLRALADAGRRVPDDIGVVGFDDLDDSADYRPPLTTVRQDFDLLGEQAVSALVSLITGETVAPQVLPTSLTLRASTAPR